MPTSGPDGGGGVTNTGVAAHISAASPGGARHDETLTSEMRSDIANGIWLCQTHAKLIDDDELTYTPAVLRDWKETSEHMAALEARGLRCASGSSMQKTVSSNSRFFKTKSSRRSNAAFSPPDKFM